MKIGTNILILETDEVASVLEVSWAEPRYFIMSNDIVLFSEDRGITWEYVELEDAQ